MYKNKKGRVNLETIKKLYVWADTSEVAIEGVKPLIEHLAVAYTTMDEIEEARDADMTFLLEEIHLLEQMLSDEVDRNENYELVIH